MTKTRNNAINWRIRLLMIKFWCMRIAHKAIKPAIIALLAVIAYTAIFRTEIDKGTCLNKEQDGALDYADPNYNYISYRCTDAKPGDRVFTILILNPLNTYCDDYIYRHDWIIGR